MPFISKIFEKIIQLRLSKQAESSENFFLEEQHGFRKKRSCATAISVLSQSIYNRIKLRNASCGVIYVDLQSAFPSANRLKLLHKIVKFNIFSPSLVRLIADYLCCRYVVYTFNNYVSSLNVSILGVPQGTILSAFLFLLFINDIDKALSQLDLIFVLFADDLTICHHDPNVLQTAC